MNLTYIVFSPTGTTAKVARILAATLGEGRIIDLTDRRLDLSGLSFGEEEVCVVAAPVYAGRIPGTAAQRLSMIRGGGARAVLAAVYGNRHYDDALLELKDVTEKAGFRPVAAVAAVAEHSILRQFAAGRPDIQDEVNLTELAGRIKEKLASGEVSPVQVPGDANYVNRKGAAMVPSADVSLCIRCGLCARKCPVGAIPAESPSKTDGEVCISCMRCVTRCPVKARQADPDALAAIGQKLAPVCTVRKEAGLWL